MTDEDIEDLFGEDPDKQETEGYTGNCGPTRSRNVLAKGKESSDYSTIWIFAFVELSC